MSIEKIWAREILDSRGNPTVEVDLYTAKGSGQGLPTAPMLALPSPGMGGSLGTPSGDGVLGQANEPGAGRGGSSLSRGARIGRSLCAGLVCDTPCLCPLCSPCVRVCAVCACTMCAACIASFLWVPTWPVGPQLGG